MTKPTFKIILIATIIVLAFLLAAAMMLRSHDATSPTGLPAAPGMEKAQKREKFPRLTPQTISSNGVYQLSLMPQYASDLARQYDFIRAAMEPPESPDGSPFVIDIAFPDVLKVADLRLNNKNLRLFTVFMDSPLWCRGKACSLALYAAPAGKPYQRLLSVNSRADNTFVMVDDESVSLVTCERTSYTRWRLADGALDRPLPLDAPGYLIPSSRFDLPGVTPCGQNP